ncbi:MAG: WS/DGAT domain-containing protein [Bacteroidota bacterium]
MNLPEKFDSYAQDWFNFLAGYGVSDFKISTVLFFKSAPDIELLKQSVRLLLLSEPILACRFDADNDKPQFVRHADINIDEYFSLLRNDATPENFLSIPMDSERMISLGFQNNGDTPYIVVKLNHICGDAAALKQAVVLLAGIYSSLSADPSFIPESNVYGERSQQLLFKALGIDNPISIFNPALSELKSNWAFPFKSCDGNGRYALSFRRIDAGRFLELKDSGKRMGATINDILLTSMFRNISRMTAPLQGEPGHIHITRDMRCYLPGDSNMAIANLSAMLDIEIMPSQDRDFWDELKIIKQQIAVVLDRKSDIQNSIGCEYIGSIGFKAMEGYFTNSWTQGKAKGVCSPILSNLGILSKEPVRFGGSEVTDAYMVPPAFHAPALMLSPSSYNNVLTLCIGYYEGETQKEDVDSLLDGIISELLEISNYQD